jgi:trk system potassium uptake protein
VKIVIVGCGRVGASAAEIWDAAGHEVIVLDVSTRAFERLPSSFGGTAVRGDGTDEDVLRRAGMEGADIFIALTEGDNRNVMAAQLAVEAFEVPQVIAKINDPVRAAAYAELGIATLCRTGLMVDAMDAHLGFPPSGLAGMLAASGHHPGGDHHADPTGSQVEVRDASEPVPAAPGATMEA